MCKISPANFFFFFSKVLIFWVFQSSSINVKRKSWGVLHPPHMCVIFWLIYSNVYVYDAFLDHIILGKCKQRDASIEVLSFSLSKNFLAKKMTHWRDIVRENYILGLISRFIYLKELKVSKSQFKISCFAI